MWRRRGGGRLRCGRLRRSGRCRVRGRRAGDCRRVRLCLRHRRRRDETKQQAQDDQAQQRTHTMMPHNKLLTERATHRDEECVLRRKTLHYATIWRAAPAISMWMSVVYKVKKVCTSYKKIGVLRRDTYKKIGVSRRDIAYQPIKRKDRVSGSRHTLLAWRWCWFAQEYAAQYPKRQTLQRVFHWEVTRGLGRLGLFWALDTSPI